MAVESNWRFHGHGDIWFRDRCTAGVTRHQLFCKTDWPVLEIKMSTFCMMCGKPLVPGTRFCGQCGAALAVPSCVSNAPPTTHLSATKAVLIAAAVLLACCLVGIYDADAGKAFAGLAVLATSIWAAIDSSRLRLREYNTLLATGPIHLFMGVLLLWIVVFPSYLVVRSKIRAGLLD